jgi:hypothetical protein
MVIADHIEQVTAISKELVESGDLSIADDLKLGALILGKHPKSPETFSHRYSSYIYTVKPVITVTFV